MKHNFKIGDKVIILGKEKAQRKWIDKSLNGFNAIVTDIDIGGEKVNIEIFSLETNSYIFQIAHPSEIKLCLKLDINYII